MLFASPQKGTKSTECDQIIFVPFVVQKDLVSLIFLTDSVLKHLKERFSRCFIIGVERAERGADCGLTTAYAGCANLINVIED